MKTYDELRNICERNSRISEKVVDDFLIYYAAGHHGLEKKMEQQFARFRHVGKQLGKEAVNMLKSQYLAHKIFQKDGLIGKFLKHRALDRFKGEDRDYLLQQHKLPWRFSFSVIADEPAEAFFRMDDVFTGKQFLLYSPGVSDLQKTVNPVLWFNLIGFNGYCWQSYGPVVYYKSFEPDDIWFFATELNPDMEEAGELPAGVERDPLPYMMLLLGAAYPLTFHKEDQILYLLAEHDLATLDTTGLKKEFKTEYDNGVYRISHKQWGEHPHYAQVYFDEHKGLLLFSAMTDRGFDALVEAFNAFGHDFPAEPYLSVHLTMVTTAGEILKRKVLLNEYHDLFQVDPDPEKEKVLEDINAFIALVLPDINAGIAPDIEEAARKTGVDPETARSVVESLMDSLENIPVLPKTKPTPKKPTPKKPTPKKPTPKKPIPEKPIPQKPTPKISPPGKSVASGKQQAASKQMPFLPREREEIRLLTSDDELLFDLYLYMTAGNIRRMSPWESLYENEVFGVQVPGTDLIYFVSVMGHEGEFQALSFYKGHEGLAGFLEFRAEAERISRLGLPPESTLQASMLSGGLMTIPHLMLSFADREELEKEDLAAIKKSGVRFRGRGQWPRIEDIVPGYMPVYPDRKTLVDLFLVMKQAIIVLERAWEDDNYLYREGDPDETILVRIPTGKGPRFRWKDHYLIADPKWGEMQYAVNISGKTRTALTRLPEASQVLQLDLFMLPAPVIEKGSKGYFPFVLLMVDTLNGMVTGKAMLTPQPDLRSMYESVPQQVLEELVKSGHRPSKIEIRSDLLYELLQEILEKAGCSVALVNQMPQMDEVIGSLISQISKADHLI